MKVSLKLEDQQQTQNPILFKAKIPIAVFGLPFLSGFSATHHHSSPASDRLSLSLRTHFSSGPSLKLSYNTPTTTTAAASAIAAAPSRSLSNQIGVSNSKKLNGTDGDENSCGFVPLDRPNIWKELTVDSAAKGSILTGILMAADTELPVTKRVKVNLRWGVGILSEYEKQLPYLRVNKIKVERVEFDDVKEDNANPKQGIEGEFEMLKGMYSWMRGELNNLQKENREMRHALEEIMSQRSLKNPDEYGGGGKRGVGENPDGFEQWRMKKGNGQRETKQTANSSDVESELQKATKAASAQ